MWPSSRMKLLPPFATTVAAGSKHDSWSLSCGLILHMAAWCRVLVQPEKPLAVARSLTGPTTSVPVLTFTARLEIQPLAWNMSGFIPQKCVPVTIIQCKHTGRRYFWRARGEIYDVVKEDMKEGRMQRGGLCGGSGLTETARGREDRSQTFSLVPLSDLASGFFCCY